MSRIAVQYFTMPNSITHRLSFGTPERGGELLLFTDDTLQIRLPHAVHADISQNLHNVSETALFWGASLVIGLGAVGAILHHNRREKPAFAAFALAGTTGLGAATLRWTTTRAEKAMSSRVPLSQAALSRDGATGEIICTFRSQMPIRSSIRLLPDEFDAGEAAAFLAAVELARAR